MPTQSKKTTTTKPKTAKKAVNPSTAVAKSYPTLYDQYIDEVQSGDIITGELVKLGIQRHLNDLKRVGSEDFPYYFDEAQANRVIKFMQKLKLTAGSYQGKLWEVQPFQAFYFACVYGWKHKDTDFRRFRKVYWCTARKSAKSEKTGGEEVWHFTMDGEGKPLVVNIATTRDQAAYVYDAAHYMIKEAAKESDFMAKRYKKRAYRVENPVNHGMLVCWTADASKNDGGNPSFVEIDEWHAHDDSSMLGVAETGIGMRDQPIIKITTTAGYNKEGPDYEMRAYATKILRGEIINDQFFTMIYAMDKGDDYNLESNWHKPNPLMPITPKLDFMRQQYREAKEMGGEKLVEFLTKNLNEYTDTPRTFIESGKYAACIAFQDKEELRGRTCIIGLDLASVVDTTAVNYLFPPENGKPMYYFTDYYCPEDKFDKPRADGVQYGKFEEEGWIKRSDGNVIDAELIGGDIIENAKIFNVSMLCYDPYKAVDILTKLQQIGIECFSVAQSAQTMGGGVDMWEKMILSGTCKHDGSPVTKWQMGNIEVYTDGNGNRKFIKSKGKKKNKIDGPVAIVNSFVGYAEVMGEEKELGVEDLGYLGSFIWPLLFGLWEILKAFGEYKVNTGSFKEMF